MSKYITCAHNSIIVYDGYETQSFPVNTRCVFDLNKRLFTVDSVDRSYCLRFSHLKEALLNKLSQCSPVVTLEGNRVRIHGTEGRLRYRGEFAPSYRLLGALLRESAYWPIAAHIHFSTNFKVPDIYLEMFPDLHAFLMYYEMTMKEEIELEEGEIYV